MNTLTNIIDFSESTSCTTSSGKVKYNYIEFKCRINGNSVFHKYLCSILLFQMCIIGIPIIAWQDEKKKLIPKSLKKLGKEATLYFLNFFLILIEYY